MPVELPPEGWSQDDQEELELAMWSDPEVEKLIAHSVHDPECLERFLKDARRSGEDTEILRREVASEADKNLSPEQARRIKFLVGRTEWNT